MTFRNAFGVATSLLAATVLLSGSAFAAPGDFNFSTILTDNGGSTTITQGTPNRINTSDVNDYATYTNGANSSTVSSGSFIGLTSYSDQSTDPPSTVSALYTDAITITDLTTGQSITQNLTGGFSGQLGTNTGTVTQTFDQSSLTFHFADGTYTLSGLVPGAIGPPGDSSTFGTRATVTFSSPEPSALALIVPGVLGTVGLARRRKSAK